MKTFHEFQREIIRLRKLYNAGVDAFTYKRKNLYIENKSKTDLEYKVFLGGGEDNNFLIAETMKEYQWQLKDFFAKDLRAIFLIRVISALEVYLIDSIREIFVLRKDLFHKQNSIIDFTHSELLSSKSISSLWSKLINKECRNLQNQGFTEVRKYYKTNFGIGFENSEVSIKYLEKIHDIRHLLVHRLGKVDEIFKHKYNFTKAKISLTQEEFYQALNGVINFGIYLNNEIDKITLIEKDKKKKIESTGVILIQFDETINLDFVYPDFTFLSKEEVLLAKDIVDKYDVSDKLMTISVSGEQNHVSAYLKELRNLEKEELINIIEKKITNPTKKPNLTNDQIELIRTLFGKGANKTDISQKLAVSKTKVSRTIDWLKENHKT